MIILVHGWCGDRSLWRQQTRGGRFAGKAIAVDLPGHGSAAEISTPAAISIAGFAAHVSNIAERATSGPVVLVGHSMGGPVALEAAIALKERCALLVGVDTFTDRRFYARRPADEIAARLERVAADFEGEINAMVERIVAPQISRELVTEIAAAMIAAPRANALASLQSLLSYDIQSRWPLLASPAVTINSAFLADPATELHLPGLVVEFMADVGHFPMLEAPAAFDKKLADVIDRAGLSPRRSSAGPR